MSEEISLEEPSYSLAYRFNRILVPIIPKPHAQQAIDVAIDLAQRYGSKIVFLHIARSEKDYSIEKVKDMLKTVESSGIDFDFKLRTLKPGETVASEIVKELSESKYDLIIMSTRGYYGATALIYESTSIAVAIAANTSILILR